MRVTILTALLLCCRSPTAAFCDDWAQATCARVWQCTVEQSQTREPFLSQYGHSERECGALWGAQCEAQNPCPLPPEASRACLQATQAMRCDQLLSTGHCVALCAAVNTP